MTVKETAKYNSIPSNWKIITPIDPVDPLEEGYTGEFTAKNEVTLTEFTGTDTEFAAALAKYGVIANSNSIHLYDYENAIELNGGETYVLADLAQMGKSFKVLDANASITFAGSAMPTGAAFTIYAPSDTSILYEDGWSFYDYVGNQTANDTLNFTVGSGWILLSEMGTEIAVVASIGYTITDSNA